MPELMQHLDDCARDAEASFDGLVGIGADPTFSSLGW